VINALADLFPNIGINDAKIETLKSIENLKKKKPKNEKKLTLIHRPLGEARKQAKVFRKLCQKSQF
jgi:hypothetical protein